MRDDSLQPSTRLFFALTCPPEQKRAIARWRSALRLRGGRPVPTDNFHVTLLFLGAVDVALISDICTAAQNIRTPGVSMKLVLDRLETWHRAGVLALTPEQAPPELLRLVYALEQAMLPLMPTEVSREYRPHLTLMRDYRLEPPESTSAPDFYLRADHFALYESHKGGYRELAAWPLA